MEWIYQTKQEMLLKMEENSREGDFKPISHCQLFGQGDICLSVFTGLSKFTIHKRGLNEKPANHNYLSEKGHLLQGRIA
jgi:hypothetical protein